MDYGLKGLAPIKEKDEQPRSADPRDTNSYKYKNPANYQYRMKNEAKGFKADEKENNVRLPKINDKSYLQKQGAAILAAGGNRYLRPDSVNISKNNVLNNIYGSNHSHVQKPPLGVQNRYQQDRSHLYGAPGGGVNNYQ